MIKLGKEMVKEIALSFFFCSLFIVIIYLCLEEKINFCLSLINKVTIVEKKNLEEIPIHLEKKRLTHYPNYGEKYGSVKISSINLELPLYHGDTLDILRYGVGHYAGSYFPGENGSIVLAAHNNVGFLRNLPEVKIAEQIEIITTYGKFIYEVTKTKIALESDLSSFPIQSEEELLILYTCYPVTAIGHTEKRYIVYAKKVEEHHEN